MTEQTLSPLRLFSLEEVAELLGCSERTVRRKILAGEMDYVQVGKYRRMTPDQVKEYVERSTVSPVNPGSNSLARMKPITPRRSKK